MDEPQLRQHLTILGWLHLGAAGFAILIGGFLFIVLISIGLAIHDHEATPILTVVAVAVACFLVLLSLPGLLAGYGLLKHRPWARILAIVVGALHLYNIPIGTALGVYTFIILADPKSEALFRNASTTVEAR
jgi:hypothetical protein